jgi:hypothetical protein
MTKLELCNLLDSEKNMEPNLKLQDSSEHKMSELDSNTKTEGEEANNRITKNIHHCKTCTIIFMTFVAIGILFHQGGICISK